MFGRGSVAASFVLIIVSNGQELQQLYHRCLVEDQYPLFIIVSNEELQQLYQIEDQ